MHVGQGLRQIREQRGVSLRELARRLGISHTALSDRERGSARIDAGQSPSLAEELGVWPADFYEESGSLDKIRDGRLARELGKLTPAEQHFMMTTAITLRGPREHGSGQ